MKYVETHENFFSKYNKDKNDNFINFKPFEDQISEFFYNLNDLSYDKIYINDETISKRDTPIISFMSYSFFLSNYSDKKEEIEEEIQEIRDRVINLDDKIKIKIIFTRCVWNKCVIFILIYSGKQRNIDIQNILSKHWTYYLTD